MKKGLLVVLILVAMLAMAGCGKVSETNPVTDEVVNAPENTDSEVDADDKDVLIRDKYMVSGSFTVTVRGVIQDYVVDEEPRIAIVTEFQDYPFLLTVGDEIGRQLEEGKAYVFTMEPMEVELVRRNTEAKRTYIRTSELVGIKIIDFRLATEDEIGLASLQPTIE